jgi:hypothetical protein
VFRKEWGFDSLHGHHTEIDFDSPAIFPKSHRAKASDSDIVFRFFDLDQFFEMTPAF